MPDQKMDAHRKSSHFPVNLSLQDSVSTPVSPTSPPLKAAQRLEKIAQFPPPLLRRTIRPGENLHTRQNFTTFLDSQTPLPAPIEKSEYIRKWLETVETPINAPPDMGVTTDTNPPCSRHRSSSPNLIQCSSIPFS